MSSFAAADGSTWTRAVDGVRQQVAASATLEQASMIVARMLTERFASAAVLARVYATVPHAELPRDVAAFVDGLAPGATTAATPVLALLGTYGVEEPWRDRRTSKGHRGIPLVSGNFVDAIPMLARLLRELGVDLSWLDESPDVLTRKMLGGFNGLFYVGEAATALDARGRHIIPAQDFVRDHGVRSVFGAGGFYPDGTTIVCIVFARECVARLAAEELRTVVSMLKGETFRLVRERRIFA